MKTSLILSLLMVLFVSCEKDYDLIAEYCTLNSPNGSCSYTDTTNHGHEDIEKRNLNETLEVTDLKFGASKSSLVFIFTLSHKLDERSLFYSGTELDNIIITTSEGENVLPVVEVNNDELRVSPFDGLKQGVSYSVTLKKSIRNDKGQNFQSDQTYHAK